MSQPSWTSSPSSESRKVRQSPLFPQFTLHASGFYLGTIHDGNIDPKTRELNKPNQLVKLADFDFISRYEAPLEAPQAITDEVFMPMPHSHASSRVSAHPLSYALGTIFSTLSHATMHEQAVFCGYTRF